MVRVLVNGVGVIGKRVAHAVLLQDDMELVGVSDAHPSGMLLSNLEKGYLRGVDLYASTKEFEKNFKGVKIKGNLPKLLKSGGVDVVVDCTPAGVEKEYKKLYQKVGVKQVYQGGADPSISSISFSTFANYKKAWRKRSARVVSCNTTSIIRTHSVLDEQFGVEESVGSLVRRGTDPWNDKKGPINATVPVLTVPSHHAVDARLVMPNLKITTLAVKTSTTLMHVHMFHVKLKKPATTREVLKLFNNTPRIRVVKGKAGLSSTATVMESGKDRGSPRGDVPEVVVWKESVKAVDKDLFWIHAVHSESVVIPENVDCIRSLTGLEKNKWECVKKTDKNLNWY